MSPENALFFLAGIGVCLTLVLIWKSVGFILNKINSPNQEKSEEELAEERLNKALANPATAENAQVLYDAYVSGKSEIESLDDEMARIERVMLNGDPDFQMMQLVAHETSLVEARRRKSVVKEKVAAVSKALHELDPCVM